MTALLQLNGLTRRFAGLTAVDDVSTSIAAGEIRGLIGPNGAGKTTLLNLIGGLIAPSGGAIAFGDEDVTAAAAHRRAAMGMRRTFQNLKLFETLSSLQNVLIGLHADGTSGVLGAVFRTPATMREERALRARAEAALDLVGLADVAQLPAAALPYGHKRLLEIARAVVAKPRLLLLDEPAAGLNPTEAASLVELVRRLGASGITILLVEHHMDVIMSACSRITVLNYGKLLAEGSPAEIQDNPEVIEAYLGRPGLEERLAAYA
jgi:branched-chain amino acid transport system ATP-binding protein